jgi:hypothetical protein
MDGKAKKQECQGSIILAPTKGTIAPTKDEADDHYLCRCGNPRGTGREMTTAPGLVAQAMAQGSRVD